MSGYWRLGWLGKVKHFWTAVSMLIVLLGISACRTAIAHRAGGDSGSPTGTAQSNAQVQVPRSSAQSTPGAVSAISTLVPTPPIIPRAGTGPARATTRTPLPPLARPPRPTFAPDRLVGLSQVPDRPDPNLREVILMAIGGANGPYGVAVKNLSTGQTAEINGEREYMSASLFKLGVMYEAHKQAAEGTLRFSETVTITEKAAAQDSGTLAFPIGSKVTISRAISEMITLSDNALGVVMLDRVKSWLMNETMTEIGLSHTRVTREDQVTSPKDMLRLMEFVATGQAVNRPASAEMLGLLLQQKINDRLPYYLPPDVQIAHKTGEWEGIRHDVGIIYAPNGPYAIAVLSAGLDSLAEGRETIARLSAEVYNYFLSPSRPESGRIH